MSKSYHPRNKVKIILPLAFNKSTIMIDEILLWALDQPGMKCTFVTVEYKDGQQISVWSVPKAADRLLMTLRWGNNANL